MSDRAFYGPADSWLEDKQVVFAEEYHKLERELAEAKAALNKCQMALNADNHETYLELKFEALSEIAKLKGTK